MISPRNKKFSLPAYFGIKTKSNFLESLILRFTFSSFFFLFLACQLFLYFLFILVSIEYLFCRFLCLSLFFIIICVFDFQFNCVFCF